MKRITFSIFLFIFCFVSSFGFKVTVVHDSSPVVGAEVIGYNSNMKILQESVTDSIGTAEFNNPDIVFVNAEHSEFTSRLVRITDHRGIIIELKPAINLDEVKITASNRKEYLTHDSYTLSAKQMENYATFYGALAEIPNINILPSGALYYEGNSNVKLLLNGIDTSRQELSTISKSDILKIDIYNTPTGRFAASGVDAIINVVTKDVLVGGNLGLNVDQSVSPLRGDNSFALYYNYRRSRFSIQINNDNNHFSKIRQNSILRYEFDGNEYEKIKRGRDSKRHTDINTVRAFFQNNKVGSYLYNLEVGGKFYRNGRNIVQDVTSNGSEFEANKSLRTKYNNFWVANYFEKQLGEKGAHGAILANVNYKHFENNYQSYYREFEYGDESNPFEDHFNAYKTSLDMVLGEVEYEFPQKKWRQMYAVIYGNYSDSKYKDQKTPFSQTKYNVGGIFQMYIKFNKLYMVGFASFSYYHSDAHLLEKSYSKLSPSVKISFQYRYNQSLSSRLAYSYSTRDPSIAQLSETNQWLDNYLIYHGNSSLIPSQNHKISFTTSLSSKYINGNILLQYENSPDYICNQYLLRLDYILETIVNLKQYYTYYGQLTFTLKPLGNNSWTIFSRVLGAKTHGIGPEYRWNGYRFQWNAATSYIWRRWTFSLSYQFPGKVADGQQILPRGESWDAEVLFRPMNDLSVGVYCQMPFGKAFKECERTVGSALVYSDTETILKDWANRVAVKLSWNVSFGKNKNKKKPQFGNDTQDTGLLEKE